MEGQRGALTEEFYETDHWKLLATAKRFLTGADVLRRSAEYESSKVLFTPVLHLLAHGIEVLLKANLIGAGLTLDEVRKKYGHDIAALWAHDLNRVLRDEAASEARKVWQSAQAEGRWQDRFDDNPVKLLEEYLAALNTLHTAASEYALRYVAASEMTAPRPHLLIETFLPISDLCVRQPRVLLPSS